MIHVTPDGLDATRLGQYLRHYADGFAQAPVVQRLSGGQSNPTYRVEAGGRCYALRT